MNKKGEISRIVIKVLLGIFLFLTVFLSVNSIFTGFSTTSLVRIVTSGSAFANESSLCSIGIINIDSCYCTIL